MTHAQGHICLTMTTTVSCAHVSTATRLRRLCSTVACFGRVSTHDSWKKFRLLVHRIAIANRKRNSLFGTKATAIDRNSTNPRLNKSDCRRDIVGSRLVSTCDYAESVLGTAEALDTVRVTSRFAWLYAFSMACSCWRARATAACCFL